MKALALRPQRMGRVPAGVVLVSLGGITVGLLISLAAWTVGPLIVLVAFAAIAALPLIGRSDLLLLLLFSTTIMFEDDLLGAFPLQARFYTRLPQIGLNVTDLLLLMLVLGVVLDVLQSGRKIRLPEPFTLPLLVLAIATISGTVLGYFSGGRPIDTLNSIHTLAFLVAIPFLAVNIRLPTRTADRLVWFAGALAILKGLIGVGTVALGLGRPLDGSIISFYEPATNWLLLAFLLVVFAMTAIKQRVPGYVFVLSILPLAALVLSFRRSFWIAAILGIALITLYAVRGTGLVIRVAIVLVVLVSVGLVVRSDTSLVSSSVVQRAQELSPLAAKSNVGDRYRIAEQKNVFRDILQHPVFGVGLGVPWTVKDPLPFTFAEGRNSTHMIYSWYWLKLGLLGLFGYLTLLISVLVVCHRLWIAGNQTVKPLGVGLMAAFTGLAVAEATAAFTGVDLRHTVVVATAIGWLAIKKMQSEPAMDAS